MDDLWMREMTARIAEPVAALGARERIELMADALEFAAYRSATGLYRWFTPEVDRLLRTALRTARAGAVPGSVGFEEFCDAIGPLIDVVSPANSALLMTAMDLVSATVEGARPGDVTNLLSNCYDVTMQAQGFGRRITLADQLGSEPCLEIIRQQQRLLAGATPRD
ncbi:hypothetical protein [Winogradskya humida]|uniref:TetR family transcriptional regulator n=1 Tax=Winogradskya humida TaxID=113566 RepID=A0ABQ3ZY89_9ACTN|nr:hypothetical protein [Actinoplanes humidus]GIE23545.1 hypothetical protein Ahu01nite_066470 [Actinoplanes humidus]